MSKIRMNTEYRNKFYNRIKDVFEKEKTQEQQAFMQSREDFNIAQISAFSLAKELGIELDEAELVRTNSTGLTIYNPSNLASMIKGMKNKNQTREQKILARKQYEEYAYKDIN